MITTYKNYLYNIIHIIICIDNIITADVICFITEIYEARRKILSVEPINK